MVGLRAGSRGKWAAQVEANSGSVMRPGTVEPLGGDLGRVLGVVILKQRVMAVVEGVEGAKGGMDGSVAVDTGRPREAEGGVRKRVREGEAAVEEGRVARRARMEETAKRTVADRAADVARVVAELNSESISAEDEDGVGPLKVKMRPPPSLGERERAAEKGRVLNFLAHRARRQRSPMVAMDRIRRVFLAQRMGYSDDKIASIDTSSPVGRAGSVVRGSLGGTDDWWVERVVDSEWDAIGGIPLAQRRALARIRQTKGDTFVYASACTEVSFAGADENTREEGMALVDSGAGASIIGGALAKTLGLAVEPPGLDRPSEYLRSASGEYMEITGRALVRWVYSNGVADSFSCYVVPNFAHGLLLGTDYLGQVGATLSFSTGELTTDRFPNPGSGVPLSFKSKERGRLYVDGNVVLPASTRGFVKARFNDPDEQPAWVTSGATVEVTRLRRVSEEFGVMVAAAWYVIGEETHVWLQVVNPYERDQVLPDGLNIALYEQPDVKVMATLVLLNDAPDDDLGVLAAGVRAEGGGEILNLTAVAAPTEEEMLTALPPGQDFDQISKSQAGKMGTFEDLLAEASPAQRKRELVKKIQAVTTLTPSEKIQAIAMMERHLATFSDSPGYSSVAELEINTGAALPVSKRPYRNPLVANAGFLKQLEQWEEKGIIRRSKSAWAAPCLLVPKKNGAWRTVIDYRGLNKLLEKESNPVPIISEVLDNMGGCRFFSTMDLTSGYYQLGVREEDKHKTAFTTPFGLYEFNRCPQGISNAVPTFQRTMELLLRGSLGISALVFLDDVIVFSPTFSQHLLDLERVLESVGRAGMTFKLAKCDFFCEKVVYLGHVITADGIRVCEDKVKAVNEFPQPDGPTKVKSFLGLAGFYRRFVRGFSTTAKPLFELTKKGVSFAWSPEAQSAFAALQHSLTTAPVLQYPDFTQPMELHVDACDIGGGATLCQPHSDQQVHPIAYWSTIFSGAQLNYGTVEKECLALVMAIRHFRPYILGRPLTVYTDHKPLQWLNKISDPSGRLTRWALMLQDYDLTVQYKPGREHGAPDGLSRAHDVEGRLRVSAPLEDMTSGVMALTRAQGTREDPLPTPNNVIPPKPLKAVPLPSHHLDGRDRTVLSDSSADWLASTVAGAWENRDKGTRREELIRLQQEDPDLHPYLQLMGLRAPDPLNDIPSHILKQRDLFANRDGLLCRVAAYKNLPSTCVVVVAPRRLVPSLLSMAHDDPLTGGHLSVSKVFDKLKARYWWPSMFHDVDTHCRACTTCATGKGRLGPKVYGKIPLPDRPFELIGIDTIGPLPRTVDRNEYVIVVTDYHTRWVEAYPSPRDDADAVSKVLLEVFSRHGCPDRMISDRGASYLNDAVDRLCARLRT